MEWNRAGPEWEQIKALIRNRWRRLADDELNWIEGCEHRLAGLIRMHYGIEPAEAEQEIWDFCRECLTRSEERDEMFQARKPQLLAAS